MAHFYAPNCTGDLLARYIFIEPLLSGRRVLEIGAGQTNGASAMFLAERGAAAVLSVDSDPSSAERAAEAVRHPFVQFRALDLTQLPPHAFDLILVADGSALTADPERVALYAGLLAREGFLVTAIPAGGAALATIAGLGPQEQPPAYETFYNVLAAQFGVVEMASQSATAGYMIEAAHEPDEEPDITVDESAAGAPEAAYYLAICGETASDLSGLCLVRLPVAPLVEGAGVGAAANAALQSEANGLRVHVTDLEAQLAETNERGAQLEIEAARLREDQSSVAARVREIEEERERSEEALFEAQAARDRAQANETEHFRELEEVRATASSETRRALEERDRALAALEAANSEALETEATLQASRSEAQAARAGVEAAVSRAAAAETRADDLEESLEATELEVEKTRQALTQAEVRIQTLDAESQQLRADLSAKNLALGEALRSATALAERVAHERTLHEERLGELERTRDAGQVERDELRARAAAAEERLAVISAKVEEVEQLQERLGELQENLAAGQAEREALGTRLTELSTTLDEREQTGAAFQTELEETRGALARAQAALDDERGRTAEIEQLHAEALEAERGRSAELEQARIEIEEAERTRAVELEQSQAALEAERGRTAEVEKAERTRAAELEQSQAALEAERGRAAEVEEAERTRAAELEQTRAALEAERGRAAEIEEAERTRAAELEQVRAALEAERARIAADQQRTSARS